MPTFVADEIVAAAKINLIPKGILAAPATLTANSAAFTSEADITGLSVAVNVAAGRAIRIAVDFGLFSTVTSDFIQIRIKEGTTTLRGGRYRIQTANSIESHYLEVILMSPSTGAHTYKISAQRLSGSGSCILTGGGDSPSALMVEDIGDDPDA